MSEGMVITWGLVQDCSGLEWSYWIHDDGAVELQPEHTQLRHPIEFSVETLQAIAARAGTVLADYRRAQRRLGGPGDQSEQGPGEHLEEEDATHGDGLDL